MQWDAVMLDAIVPLWEGDAALVAALGGKRIYMMGSNRPVQIPSVEWLPIADTLTEAFNPVTIQVDYFATSTTQAFAIERRLRVLTHRETMRVLGDMKLWTRYAESNTNDYPKPGVIHRSLRFLLEPVRERYTMRES
jgi:hypothetical protein